jgi:hypothetical protein
MLDRTYPECADWGLQSGQAKAGLIDEALNQTIGFILHLIDVI